MCCEICTVMCKRYSLTGSLLVIYENLYDQLNLSYMLIQLICRPLLCFCFFPDENIITCFEVNI